MKERYFSIISVITSVLRLKNLELNKRYRINRHQHIMVFSFGILKRAILLLKFFFFFSFVIFNVRFELSKLEMTCRVKLGIIMPSLVTVQNAALGRFSTDRQPVLLYIPCKFWL